MIRITKETGESVSICKVEITEQDCKEGNGKVVERVKKFNLGGKPGVPTIIAVCPVDFLPAL